MEKQIANCKTVFYLLEQSPSKRKIDYKVLTTEI